MKAAFRLYLAAAKAGDRSCQLNAGYCYDVGKGVKRNRGAAIRWYLRAYRAGDPCAATNIGTVYRDEGQRNRALAWFRKAVAMGQDEANLEIAKVLLKERLDLKTTRKCLEKVVNSDCCTEGGMEEARRLLKKLS